MTKIFDNPQTAATKEAIFAANVDGVIKNIAMMRLQAYKRLRQMFYQNPNFRKPDGSFDSDAAYAAFAQNTQLGITPEQVGQMARLEKTAINFFQPGVIVDDVPEAKIEF